MRKTPTVIKGKHYRIQTATNKKGRIVDINYLKALYIDWMTNPMNAVDTRSKARFCQVYGCPPALVKEWSRQKETQKEIRGHVRELFGGGEKVKELYDKLWEQARSGRVSAIKLALELVGEYTPKLQHLDKPKSLEDLLDKMDEDKDAPDTHPVEYEDKISPTKH